MDSRQTHAFSFRPGRMLRQVVGVAMAASLALLTLAGCGATRAVTNLNANCPSASTESSWHLVAPGKLTVITNTPYVPAEFPDPKHHTTIIGYDMDIAAALAKQMCLTLVVNNNVDFQSIIPGISGPPLGQQGADLAMAAITINSARQQTVDMIPYFQAGESLVVTPDNPAGLTSDYTTWCGKAIAAQDGTLEFQQLQDLNGGDNSTGEPPICKSKPITIVDYPNQSDIVQQVLSGIADASYQDSPLSGYYIAQNTGKLQLGPMPSDQRTTPDGIVVRKDNPAFETAVKAALAAIRADGTYKTILTNWGQQNGAYPPLG